MLSFHLHAELDVQRGGAAGRNRDSAVTKLRQSGSGGRYSVGADGEAGNGVGAINGSSDFARRLRRADRDSGIRDDCTGFIGDNAFAASPR